MTEVKTGTTFAPLCIWCSAPWSDENVRLEIHGACNYDSDQSCGWPAVTIKCHVCNKIMYQKGDGEYDDC